MNESFAFSDLCRRVANLIRIGKIAEVDGAQVKVQIGKVKTNWLPIVSTAGDTTCWIPIAAGEQVMVFSPYGEMAQSVVIRSIHYNKYAAPENKNDVALNSKTNVKISGDEKLEAIFKKGFELKSGNTEITAIDGKVSFNSGSNSIISEGDQITIKAGNASITLSSSGIQLSRGASTIDLSDSGISLNSNSISTSPPICKCTGGL